MNYTISILAIAVAFAILAIYVRLSHKNFAYSITKIIASACFLILGLVASYSNLPDPKYTLFIVLGLVSGVLGDVFLGIKEIAPTYRKKLIPCGIVAFLIGHIFYLYAFTIFTDFNYWVFIASALLAIIALLLFIILKYKKEKGLYAILTLYAFLEASVCCQVGYFLYLAPANIGIILAFTGTIVFCISDSVLSYLYFGKKTNKKDTLVLIELVTYYSAQILIALSLGFI